MELNTLPTAIPERVMSSKKQGGIEPGDTIVSPGKEDLLKMSGERTDQLTVMEKQQNLEYTTDDSVNSRGKQAVIARTGGHRSLPFTLGCLFLVRTAYDAVATNLVVYLTKKLHINNSKAASDVNSWLASLSVFSLSGAIVADSYLGRSLTSLVSILVHMIGMAILVIATALPSLKPHTCTGICAETTGIRKAVFYLGLYITALGCGSFFPCLIAFGADQYDEGHPIEINAKSRYFSLSYLALSCGGILGNTIIIYIEQSISFTLGYAISLGVLAIALLLNAAGTPLYRFQKPKGNPITRIVQVWVAAARKWGIKVSAPDKQLYEAPGDSKTGTRKLLHRRSGEESLCRTS